jgi:hypothetical protein
MSLLSIDQIILRPNSIQDTNIYKKLKSPLAQNKSASSSHIYTYILDLPANLNSFKCILYSFQYFILYEKKNPQQNRKIRWSKETSACRSYRQ